MRGLYNVPLRKAGTADTCSPLGEIALKVRVRKLFGYNADELLNRPGKVSIGLFWTAEPAHNGTQIGPWHHTARSLAGRWDEWLELGVSYDEILPGCHLVCKYEDLYSGTLPLLDANCCIRQGLYKVEFSAHDDGHDSTSERYDMILKEVEAGTWQSVDWLDSLSFSEIAKQQSDRASREKRLYLIIELIKFDAHVRLTEEANDKGTRSMRAADSAQRPSRSIFTLPSVARPSARSLPLLRKLERDGTVWQLPGHAPGLLWKYREWLSVNSPRALPLFIKSVDWVDHEELAIAKAMIPKWSVGDPSLIMAMLTLVLGHADLHVFDEEICSVLAKLRHHSEGEAIVYSLCQFLRSADVQTRGRFRRTHQLIEEWVESLVQSADVGRYAAQSVYWMLQRTDWLEEGQAKASLMQQQRLVDQVQEVVRSVRAVKGPRLHKVAALCRYLGEPANALLLLRPPVPLPTEPEILVSSVIPERSAVYKSNAMPVKVAFLGAEDSAEHAVIVKTDENLEGDLLVVRALRLINELLIGQGLDLRIITYSVLPTPKYNGGWLEFVRSASLSLILGENQGSLLPYLDSLSPEHPGLARTNYLRSCAGYSLITFVLGIGDRHLENLLISDDGRLFHVDYAYRFGADPKPFPPPMKLCREMVEAMGGTCGSDFSMFKSLLLQAFQVLRSNAHVLLDLLTLHSRTVSALASKHAAQPLVSLSDISFVRDRLGLDTDDATALRTLEQLVEESVTALFPQVFEAIHKWSQYWRS